MAAVDLPTALSYLQVTADGGASVYEHLVNLVTKVRAALLVLQKCLMGLSGCVHAHFCEELSDPCTHTPWSAGQNNETRAQVLEEKPTNAVDLQELSLLAKKTAFDGKETSPLLPIPVRLVPRH